MKPSKKKSKKTQKPSSPPPPAEPKTQQQNQQREEKIEAEKANSCKEEERNRDLSWLMDAFSSSVSIDRIESTHDLAGGDPFKAAAILGSHIDVPSAGPTVSGSSSSHKKPRNWKPRQVIAASGMVSDVIGKDYASPGSGNWGKERRKMEGEIERRKMERNSGCELEGAEQFLCSMMGDESELGLGVIRDVLGQCGGDVEKALDALLDLSDSSYHQHKGKSFPINGKNGLNYSNIFNGITIKNSPQRNLNSLQSTDKNHALTYNPSEIEHDFLLFEDYDRRTESEARIPVPRQTKPEIQQKVLESLFNVPELPKYEPGPMDWRKIVKKLQSSGQGSDFNLDNEQPKKVKCDGYREFRTVATQNWDMMKAYYQRAAFAYSKGDRAHASYLAEKGKYYRDLARQEDEKASLEIFGVRNRDIKNTVTIDLHGQHVKQAIELLKRHLLLFACVPSVHYLRVITGCGLDGVGKGKVKRSVFNLVEREGIKWTEENSGTILLHLDGKKEYSFIDSDGDNE